MHTGRGYEELGEWTCYHSSENPQGPRKLFSEHILTPTLGGDLVLLTIQRKLDGFDSLRIVQLDI